MADLVKISDLRQRDVINIIDGRRLGPIKDIDLDVEKGMVRSIILPSTTNLFGIFSRSEDVVVGWDNIKKIGVDVILIELQNFANPRHD